MNSVLMVAAIIEGATGAVLLVVPSLVGLLLFGELFTGIAIPVARLTGIALISLAVACWRGPSVIGMLTYNALVTLYLAHLGVTGGPTGILLWPVVALHAVMTVLLAYAAARRPRGLQQ